MTENKTRFCAHCFYFIKPNDLVNSKNKTHGYCKRRIFSPYISKRSCEHFVEKEASTK